MSTSSIPSSNQFLSALLLTLFHAVSLCLNHSVFHRGEKCSCLCPESFFRAGSMGMVGKACSGTLIDGPLLPLVRSEEYSDSELLPRAQGKDFLLPWASGSQSQDTVRRGPAPLCRLLRPLAQAQHCRATASPSPHLQPRGKRGHSQPRLPTAYDVTSWPAGKERTNHLGSSDFKLGFFRGVTNSLIGQLSCKHLL